MKRHGRTTLFLSPMIVVPILATAMVYRSRVSDSLVTTPRVSELPLADSEIAQKYKPVVAVTTSSGTSKAVRFQMFKVQGRKSIQELEARLGPDLFTLILKINRLDRKHLRDGELLVVPDNDFDAASVSPLPLKLETARSIPKLILVSRRAQAFGAYEFGELVRWGATSTGKKSTPTPAGLFHTNWKSREKRSSINQSWILPWCFNLDDSSGVAFHKFDLPGYPASHGCVRLLEEDAKWIYDWAEQWLLSKTDHSLVAYGTPVIIFGDYSYGEKAPWKRLVEDPAAAVVSVADIERVLSQHLPTIASRTHTRETLIAQLAKPTN